MDSEQCARRKWENLTTRFLRVDRAQVRLLLVVMCIVRIQLGLTRPSSMFLSSSVATIWRPRIFFLTKPSGCEKKGPNFFFCFLVSDHLARPPVGNISFYFLTNIQSLFNFFIPRLDDWLINCFIHPFNHLIIYSSFYWSLALILI